MGEDGDNDAISRNDAGRRFGQAVRPPARPTQTLGLDVTRLQLCFVCIEACAKRKARWVTRPKNITFVAIFEI